MHAWVCRWEIIYVWGFLLHGVLEFLLRYIVMYLYNYVKVSICIYIYMYKGVCMCILVYTYVYVCTWVYVTVCLGVSLVYIYIYLYVLVACCSVRNRLVRSGPLRETRTRSEFVLVVDPIQ